MQEVRRLKPDPPDLSRPATDRDAAFRAFRRFFQLHGNRLRHAMRLYVSVFPRHDADRTLRAIPAAGEFGQGEFVDEKASAFHPPTICRFAVLRRLQLDADQPSTVAAREVCTERSPVA
jgi:hypothetical protein